MSTVIVSLEPKNDQYHYLINFSNLCKILSKYKGNIYQEKCLDQVEMYIVGRGKIGDGLTGIYQVTDYEDVKMSLTDLIGTSEEYRNSID